MRSLGFILLFGGIAATIYVLFGMEIYAYEYSAELRRILKKTGDGIYNAGLAAEKLQALLTSLAATIVGAILSLHPKD